MKCRAVVLSGLMVLSVIAASGAFAAPSGATVQTAGNTATTPIDITLREPDTATHSNGAGSSQVPAIEVNRSVTYTNGTSYRFVITDEDTGGTVTTTPPINNTTSEGVIFNNPVPGGIDNQAAFWIPGVTDGVRDAPVTTSGDVTTRGVTNLSVSLVDVETGTVLDTTTSQPYVIGYVEDYSQNSTSGTIQLRVNRSTLPEDTSLTATVFNASANFPGETSDSTTTELTYDSEQDAFVGIFDAAAVSSGTFSVLVEGTLPAPYQTSFERYGSEILTVSETETTQEQTSPVTVAPSSLAGSGTPTEPYVITNASELQAIEQAPDAHYVLGSDIDASDTAQWHNGTGFDPIGSYSERFTGSFDGANHTITGLTIARPGTSNVGLFGYVENGTVENIIIRDASVTGDFSVGGLIGTNENGITQRAGVTGTISGAGTVGGIVGSNADGTIRKVGVRAAVNSSGSAGGIVGDNDGTLRQATAVATVTGASDTGGVVGQNLGTVQQAAGNVTVSGTEWVGGLVGDNQGTIQTSYVTGDVTGTTYVGGLTGGNRYQDALVTHSYATPAVSGDSVVGGLVGGNYNNGNVTSAYWDEQATGQATSALAGAGSVGLPTNAMTGETARTNMTALDFTDTWDIREGAYPVLAWQTSSPDENAPVDVNRTASTVDPRTVKVGSTQTYTVTATIENVSTAPGEVDLQLEGFELGDNEDDITVDYTADDITDGTLAVSKQVTATAPATGGIYNATVTELRADSDADDTLELQVDTHVIIEQLVVENNTTSEGTVYTVDTDGQSDYETIQAAVESASSGDTIVVKPSIYNETVRIEKPLTVVAASPNESATPSHPVLDGGDARRNAIVLADGATTATIAGFEIRNYTNIGIGLRDQHEEVHIRENYIHDINGSFYPIGVRATLYDSVQRNIDVSDNRFEAIGGSAVYLATVQDATIRNNTVRGSSNVSSEPFGDGAVAGISVTGWAGQTDSTTERVLIQQNDIRGPFTNEGIFVGALNQSANATGHIRKVYIGNNTITGPSPGLIISPQRSAGNTIAEVFVERTTFRGPGLGIVAAPGTVERVQVFESRFYNSSTDGIRVVSGNGSELLLRENIISGNDGAGLNNSGIGTVDARYNYWGAADGPRGEFNGSGDAVIGDAEVRPYFTDRSLTDLSISTVGQFDITTDLQSRTVPEGESFNTTVTVHNTGEEQAQKAVLLLIDTDGDGAFTDETVQDSDLRTLNVSETTDVTLTAQTSNLAEPVGNYSVVTVEEGGTPEDVDDAEEAPLLIEPSGPTVSVAPNETGLSPGDTFTVNLTVEDIENAFAASGIIRYDSSVVRATNISRGGFLARDGTDTALLAQSINNTTGTVDFGIARLESSTGVSGSGTLVQVQFQVVENTAPGTVSSIEFESATVSDPEQTRIPVSTKNETISIHEPLELDASLVSSVNYAGSPIRIQANASGPEIGQLEANIERSNAGPPNEVACADGSSCVKPVSVIPSRSSWNGSDYKPVPVEVRAVSETGQTVTTTISTEIRIAGDASGDGEVGIQDGVLVGQGWRSTVDSAEYDNAADLNNDGRINIFDAVILGQNWQDTAATSDSDGTSSDDSTSSTTTETSSST